MAKNTHLAFAVILFTGVWATPVLSDFTGNTLDFCNGADCVTLQIQNSAPVTVTSATVRQRKGASNCREIEKRHSGNLSGSASSGGDWFKVEADPSCRYVVKYSTSRGCSGDKRATFSTGDLKNGHRAAVLNGACNIDLKARTRRSRSGDGSEPDSYDGSSR